MTEQEKEEGEKKYLIVDHNKCVFKLDINST